MVLELRFRVAKSGQGEKGGWGQGEGGGLRGMFLCREDNIHRGLCDKGWGALEELEGKSRPFGGEVQRGPGQSTQSLLHQRFWSVSPE